MRDMSAIVRHKTRIDNTDCYANMGADFAEVIMRSKSIRITIAGLNVAEDTCLGDLEQAIKEMIHSFLSVPSNVHVELAMHSPHKEESGAYSFVPVRVVLNIINGVIAEHTFFLIHPLFGLQYFIFRSVIIEDCIQLCETHKRNRRSDKK